MSFKREGNDAGLLETLRKRRINELLSEEIPEDEAKLLCNGRFTCTVCPSNPVFDTVNVLSIHRQGKKHLSNLEVHIAKKRELKQLIAARKHQQYLKDGTTTIQMAVPAQRGIITSCPYDPRVKKSKVKQGERRPILEIGGNRGVTSTPQSFHQKPSASPVAAIVNSSMCSFSVLRNKYEQSVSGPIMHDHQLKNIFSNKLEEPVRITPYQSKFRKNIIPLQQSSVRTSLTNELPCTTVPQINALRDRLHTGVVTGSSTCSVSLSVCDPPSWNKLNSDAVSCVVVSANKSSALEDVSSCISNLKAGMQSHSLSAAAFLLPPPPPPPPPITSTSNCSQTPTVQNVAVALGKSLQPPPPPPITSTSNCSQTPTVQNVAVALGKSLRLPPPPPVVGTTGTNNCSQTPAVPNGATVATGNSLLPPPPPPHTSTNNCSQTPAVPNVAVALGKSPLPPPPHTSTNNCSWTPAVPNVAVALGKSPLPPPPHNSTNNCSRTPAVPNVAVALGKSPLPPPPHTSTNNCSRTPAVPNVAVALGKSSLPPPPHTSTNNCSRTPAVPNGATVASGKSLLPVASGDLKDQSCVSEKLRLLQGSGWKRDWDGKWIKDENAEFDSDEEAPDIP